MKRNDFLIICGIFVSGMLLYSGICSLMGYPLIAKHTNANYLSAIKTGHEGELLPDVDILLPDSLTYKNIAALQPGMVTVLFYFGPDCPYCQSEINEIIRNINHLADIRFFLITPYSYPEMRKFYFKYQLEKYNNITVGVDYRLKFGNYFNTKSIPYLAIYDSRNKLKSAFSGIVSHEQIKAVGL